MSKASDMPLVSIVVPYFNRAPFLEGLLETVRNQTYDNWELIIVDDLSDGVHAEAVAQLKGLAKVKVIRLTEKGRVSQARNVGVAEARGEYIAFLDSDDTWHPGKLRQQVVAVLSARDPVRTLCLNRIHVLKNDGEEIRPSHLIGSNESVADYLFLRQGYMQTSSYFVPTRMARETPFDRTLTHYEDYDFLIRCERAGAHFIMLEDALTVMQGSDRPDRLSAQRLPILGSGDRLLQKNRLSISRRAALSFMLVHQGRERFARQRLKTFFMALEAVVRRAISPRYACWLMLKAWRFSRPRQIHFRNQRISQSHPE